MAKEETSIKVSCSLKGLDMKTSLDRNEHSKKETSQIKNCGHCPYYGQGCDGDASDCLCLRCPRNLGQCMKVRYCSETESILDFSDVMPKEDEARLMELERLIRNWE